MNGPFITIIFTLLFARISTSYDSRVDKGRFIKIKNEKLAKLLIEQTSFRERKKLLKKDRNKMSFAGLAFYLSNVFVVLVTLIFKIIPEIPCKPLEIAATDMYLYADTWNTKVPLICSGILLCSEMAYFILKIFKNGLNLEQKWLESILKILSVLCLTVCSVGIVFLLFELFKR